MEKVKRTIKLEVTYKYTIEVDDDNYVVKEYANDLDLLGDVSSYRFSQVLPVISTGGVVIKDVELITFDNLIL